MDEFVDQASDNALWAAGVGLVVVAVRGWRPLTKALLLGFATVADLAGDLAGAVHTRLDAPAGGLSDIYEADGVAAGAPPRDPAIGAEVPGNPSRTVLSEPSRTGRRATPRPRGTPPRA